MFAPLLADGITLDTLSVLGILSGAGLVIAFLFNALFAAKNEALKAKDAELVAVKEQHAKEIEQLKADHAREVSELESTKKSYQEIGQEGLRSALDTANYYRQRDGKPPIIPAAAVVSESHSDSTAKQREVAGIATMRAKLALVKLVSGQEPRAEPDHAAEPPRPAPS